MPGKIRVTDAIRRNAFTTSRVERPWAGARANTRRPGGLIVGREGIRGASGVRTDPDGGIIRMSFPEHSWLNNLDAKAVNRIHKRMQDLAQKEAAPEVHPWKTKFARDTGQLRRSIRVVKPPRPRGQYSMFILLKIRMRLWIYWQTRPPNVWPDFKQFLDSKARIWAREGFRKGLLERGYRA